MKTRGFMFGPKVSLESLLLGPIISGQLFKYNLATWFVVPLFMVEMFNIAYRKLFFRNKSNKREYLYIISALILGMAGIYLASNGYNTGWYLALTRMLCFIPYYCAVFL